jgi:hypothetical protein
MHDINPLTDPSYFQDSLGGNSKVMMVVAISPAVYNVGETICSLNFASRCRQTELGQATKQIIDTARSKSPNPLEPLPSAAKRSTTKAGTNTSTPIKSGAGSASGGGGTTRGF